MLHSIQLIFPTEINCSQVMKINIQIEQHIDLSSLNLNYYKIYSGIFNFNVLFSHHVDVDMQIIIHSLFSWGRWVCFVTDEWYTVRLLQTTPNVISFNFLFIVIYQDQPKRSLNATQQIERSELSKILGMSEWPVVEISW